MDHHVYGDGGRVVSGVNRVLSSVGDNGGAASFSCCATGNARSASLPSTSTQRGPSCATGSGADSCPTPPTTDSALLRATLPQIRDP
eukprot:scaffold93850_cov63-Phaeocystis_antarctica.AAC.3